MSATSSDPDLQSAADANPEQEATSPDTQAQLAALQERWVRLAADFDNFKKRAARDRDEARRNGSESVIGKLLPVLDNFDMAMAAASQPSTTLENLRVGVNMIHGQFRALLSDLGVKELEAVGMPFDPTIHEAVSTQPSKDVPEGHVTQQIRRGYRLGDRLLRPASVVVSAAASAETSNS